MILRMGIDMAEISSTNRLWSVMRFLGKKKETKAPDEIGSEQDRLSLDFVDQGGKQSAPEPSGDNGDPERSAWNYLFETIIIILIAVIFAVILQAFFIKTFVITSTSMSPTLQEGDRVMVDRLTLHFREPRRGDIVLFRYPPDTPEAQDTKNHFYWPFEQMGEIFRATHKNTTPYVKRVIAVGGETVELKKGKLYIDGERIKEDYITDNSSNYGPYTVPEGTVFCMGDNRLNSRDSRAWGPVPLRSLIGRLVFIWWPPSRFGKP